MSRLLNALKKIENRGPGSAADEYQEYETTSDVWPATELAAAEVDVEVEADETGALPQAPPLPSQDENAWDESLDLEAALWPLTPVEWPVALERFESDETFWSPDGPAVEEYEAEAEDEATTENIATHRIATQVVDDVADNEVTATDPSAHDVIDVIDVIIEDPILDDATNDQDQIALNAESVAETSDQAIFDDEPAEKLLPPVDIIIGLSETAPFIAPSAGLAQVTAGALPQALTPTPELDDDSSEPATVRMADFGRPKQNASSNQNTDSPRQHEPWDAAKWNAVKGDTVSIPFLPAAERPYRQACERILAAAVESHAKGLVLAWVDNELDHSPALAKLTAAMAERLDDPVLVIDVGVQRRLAALLHAAAESRLPQAMAGLVSWRDLLVQTNTAGLCVLPSAAGDFDADPVAVARLLEACKADFGLVIVAGAALSAVPENLLSACEGAVLLVEAGYTPAAAAVDAGRRLSAGGAQLLGCLLTNAETA